MGKLKVKKAFVDKYDHKTVFRPGQVISIDDPEREKDLLKRGLCTTVKGKTSGSKDDKPEDVQKTSEEAEGAENPEEDPQQSEE